MIELFIEENNIPSEELPQLTLEQMLAMLEEQSEKITLMNIELSNQVGTIDRAEIDLIQISNRINENQEILNSDVPDEVKQQAVSEFYENVDLNNVEDQIKRIAQTEGELSDHEILSNLSDDLRMNEIGEQSEALSTDSIMSKL